MIYSIGYQKITIEQLTETLRAHNVHTLVDIRCRPYSRNKYDFNRNRLEKRFGGGIRYLWLGNILGGFCGPVPEDALLKLEALGYSHIIAIMCMENDPRDCHRYQDIGMRLLDRGIDIVHLWDGKALPTSKILEEALHG